MRFPEESAPAGGAPAAGPAPSWPPPSPPAPDERAPAPPPADGRPAWPWWAGLAGMLMAVVILVFVVEPIALLVREVAGLGRGANPPALVIAQTVLSDLAIAAAAIGTAALTVRTVRPRASHFGLRPTAFWPAVGFAALGMGTYFVFAGLYEYLYPQDVKQTTLQTLGADKGTAALIAVGVLVVVIAPLVEELFFRGFLYRSLRNGLSIPVAALIAGAIFGMIHFSTGVAATLPLAVLGVTFCLIVERTGSLYPVIALHALVNGLAYSVSPEAPDGSAFVAVPLLALMLTFCVVAPALAGRGPVGAPGEAAPAAS